MTAAKKIVIIGPESTGKSTLTEMLAQHYSMPFVTEYARKYIDEIQRDYIENDLLQIAQGQIDAEDKQLQNASSLLFCDTDLYVIKVWSEHKYKHCSGWILKQIATRSCDLYLLTDIDMPWENDPQREYPDPKMRKYFYEVYKDIVMHSSVPWACVSGNPKQRLHAATEVIAQYL